LSLSVDVRDQRGDFALDVTFEAGRGVTALFGRSGAGKTTIVNMVAGLRRPDAGRIVLDGRVLFDSSSRIDLPTRKRRVGMVFQEPRLFPHLSVRSNLLYAPRIGRRGSAGGLDAVVDLLGIEPLLKRRPSALSGGEAQRVAIGRALLAGPEILLMDEPLSQLDGARRAEILPFLDRLAHESGVPILYVSHAIDEVARLADEIVVLSEGKLVAAGPIEEVFGRIDLGAATGRYEAGALLVAVVMAHDPAFALTELGVGGQRLVVPALDKEVGERVRLRLRARDVAVALTRPVDVSIRNALEGEVIAVELERGAFAEVLIAAEGQHVRARLTRKSATELGLAPGKRVVALIKSIAVDTDRSFRRRLAKRGASP
jgi:molybdate transport system ATP-binding protein